MNSISPAEHPLQNELYGFYSISEMRSKYLIDKDVLEREYFQNNKSQEEISKMTGVPQTTISARMRKFGLKTKNRTWKMVQIIKQKMHKVNENYFDDLNSENAWVLGWLASDGYTREYKYSKCFGIRLSTKDIEIIQKIRKLIEFEGPIYENTTFLKRTGRSYQLSNIKITSEKIVDRLSEFGITQNKSLTIRFPELIENTHSEQIIKAFILGVFEGDGSVLFDEKHKSPCFQIVGTKEMLEGIQKQLITFVGVSKTKLTKNTLLTNHYMLRYRGKFQAMKLFEWLYSNQENYLNRKYQKYLETKRRLQECVA